MDWEEALEIAEEELDYGYIDEYAYEDFDGSLSPKFVRAKEILSNHYKKHWEKVREESKEDHKEYLKSEWWQKMRKRVLARDGNTCVDCEGMGWEVHHESYDNKGTEKEFNDCVCLCQVCHKKRHS